MSVAPFAAFCSPELRLELKRICEPKARGRPLGAPRRVEEDIKEREDIDGANCSRVRCVRMVWEILEEN